MNIALFDSPLRTLSFIALSTLYLFTAPIYAATPALIERNPVLTNIDSSPFDDYRVSVAVAGDTTLIGVPFDDQQGFNAGTVYVYTRSDGVWDLQQKLTASDAESGDQYGWSVALMGDTAVIGARFDDDKGFNSGSAYVYTRSDEIWNEQQKLTASDGAAKDQFGTSIALQDGTLVIGAPFKNDRGTHSGSAYIYTRHGETWHEQQKLVAKDNAPDDQYGWSVALQGDSALIGARFDDDKGFNSGSAYSFTRSAGVWSEQQKLTASDGAVNDQYGWSVALMGDTAVIGARFNDDRGVNSGSAYVYSRSAGVWREQQKLVADDGVPGAQYGWSVALAGNTLVIGAPFDNDRGVNSGSAYLYTRGDGDWTLKQKLIASDGILGERYGISVNLEGSTLVIGAYLNYEKGSLYGSTYVNISSTEEWNEVIKLKSPGERTQHK